jgi:hypothetical protein
MSSFREYQRRCVVPFACAALAAYYVFVFMPMSRKANNLDAPLEKEWRTLSASLEQTNSLTIDFLHITNQLAETRQALAILENARQKAAPRLEPGPAVRVRMNAPFELVDYENERSKEVDELVRLAKQKEVTIEPAVYFGFPEHTAEIRQPRLLWPALAMADGFMRTAIQCKVGAIHSMAVPLAQTNFPGANGSTERLAGIFLQVEFTGAFPSIGKVLQSLPLRGEELRGAGLVEAPPDKPALFVDRLVIKKQSPEKPDEVRVWMRVVGFVLRE